MDDYKAGHRKRVKEKYAKKGEGAFYDYELLEMLLFYSIPRKDTKEIAKRLLSTFGSMDNLLNADIMQTATVEEVGTQTAILIKLVADISKRALDDREKQIAVKGVDQAGEYFQKLLKNEAVEKFAVLLLDNGNRVQFSGIIDGGTGGAMDISMNKLAQLIIVHQATGLIIAHNHPKGIAKASGADVSATLTIRDFVKKIGVKLMDHIIIGSNGVYSMRSDLEYNHYFS
ncbi:MAG: RadC family protein [Eubacterium sp.]|nr:RadC family protein [Eubacterium sp.]